MSSPEAPAPYWKCIIAALPELVLGLQFLALAFGMQLVPATDGRALGLLMQVEFIVIHSMGFLGFIALLRPEDRSGRIWHALTCLGLCAAYTALAFTIGRAFFLSFLALGVVTYLGVFLSWGSPSARLQLAARWILGTLLFILATGIFGTPRMVNDWGGQPSVLYAGALYFLGLAALDLSGFYLIWLPTKGAALIEALRREADRAE